ncbi:uncharacterized protein SAPINGB_P004091 [Magnusiomyces paraingens]|uniref:Serine hydrolase domain-containing protein n=1 Tax=Magnusiomyces paraingens TaxID=2606893 RepID=A0A5E8BUX4_9ASCO|nr:uncharacterized protein SAPINGB_P004091 [Saprochaete ingens]VVT54469.1 unnamed protein product [Saprochaete ingens]
MPKILCLHGFVQNGSVFAKKSSALRKALAKAGYETVYLTAPVKIDTADLPFEPTTLGGESGNDAAVDAFRSWWPANEQKDDYYTLDQAFACVKQSVQENGPYDGVLGFSQGAGFAGILCTVIHKLHELVPEQAGSEEYKQKNIPLKFGIFYSGFRVKPDALQHFYTPPISTPSLHILGALDTVVSEERSMALYNACSPESRTLLTHPGGHFVPNSKPMVASVVNFITTQPANDVPENTSEKTPAAAPSEDWSLFDKIGQA